MVSRENWPVCCCENPERVTCDAEPHDVHCSKCGKPIEVVVEKSKYNAKPLMTGDYEITRTDAKPEVTDSEWVEQFCDKVKIAADFGMDPISVIFAADGMPLTIKNTLLIGIAEGRKRERAALLDSAEVVNASACIISEAICQQREEAAAREAWEGITDVLSQMSREYITIAAALKLDFANWWKQRKSQGGRE